ncbi:unnamed protein product [Rhizophagus irregularis]|nr:unnamed protein product [Rhizophagus irregularis]
MEYSFISRQSFNNLVKQYIENLAPIKKEKALINQEKLQKIKEVLLNPTNTTLYTSNFHYWAKNKFKLQKISSDSYIVLHTRIQNKKNDEKTKVELPVLIVENMYDKFCKIHSTITQYGGQKETWNQISSKWEYCRQDLVEKFVSQCNVCAAKLTQIRPLAGIPIIEQKFMSRLQIDLIDMTFKQDNEFKYIAHIRDHFTRYSWARALTLKHAIEVAAFLFDIFTTFGPPLILQSDNGKEFVSSIIIELVNLWSTIQIINGRLRHPASQGLVERANGILETKLGKWMEDNNRQDWSFGLRFVIYAMNNSVCRAHNKKPYELVFGGTPHEYSAIFDQLFQNNIFSEDEIPNEFEGSIQESINNLDDLIDNTTYEINSTNLNQELNLDEDAVTFFTTTTRSDKSINRGHQVLRDFACQNLETYTAKMTSAMIAKSKHKLEYEIRKYVKILIPKIDRFGTDRPVLPCKVIEKLNYNDIFKYRLRCISGILNNLYCAGELDPFGVKEYLELDHIPTDNISVRDKVAGETRGFWQVGEMLK